MKVLNYPIRIESAKYERQTFTFAFGFVIFLPNVNQQNHNYYLEMYKDTLRQLCFFFNAMENEIGYLSKQNLNIRTLDLLMLQRRQQQQPQQQFLRKQSFSLSKSSEDTITLREVLIQIFDQLALDGECSVRINDYRRITLKLDRIKCTHNYLISTNDFLNGNNDIRGDMVPILIHD
ncbi:hypothetical protein RFI_11449, partial [Reticulomyxa filosa]